MKKVVFLIAMIGMLVGNVNAYVRDTKTKIIYVCREAPNRKGYIETIRIKTLIQSTPRTQKILIGFVNKEEIEKYGGHWDIYTRYNFKYSLRENHEALIELYDGCPYIEKRTDTKWYYKYNEKYDEGCYLKVSAKITVRHPVKDNDGYVDYYMDIRIQKRSLYIPSFPDMYKFISVDTVKRPENALVQTEDGIEHLLSTAHMYADTTKYIYDGSKGKTFYKIIRKK